MRYEFIKLQDKDQQILRNIFPGRTIIAIEDLTEKETMFYYSGIFIQLLYKFKNLPDKTEIEDKLLNLVKMNESLRSAYIIYDGIPKKIILAENIDLKVNYRDLPPMDEKELCNTLRNIMEADKGEEIDVKSASPLRIAFYRTDNDEWAALFTMPALLSLYFDPREIFNSNDIVAVNYEEANTTATGEICAYPILPYVRHTDGKYAQHLYKTELPDIIKYRLNKIKNTDSYSVIAELIAAWQLLLLDTNKNGEIVSLVAVDDPKIIHGIKIFPVQQEYTQFGSIEKLFFKTKNQITDFVESDESFSDLKFNHILSFVDFFTEYQNYATAPAKNEGNLIKKDIWVGGNLPIGFYFDFSEHQPKLTARFNEYGFKPYGVDLICKRYKQIIRQSILDWNQPLNVFAEDIDEKNRSTTDTVKYKDNLPDELTKLKYFEGVDIQTIKINLKNLKMQISNQGERLKNSVLSQNFIFIISGKISRSLDTGNGWHNFLDIKSAGSWLNETCLIKNTQTKILTEVMTKEAVLILIPIDEMQRLTNDEPTLKDRLFIEVIKELEKYQRLWAQM